MEANDGDCEYVILKMKTKRKAKVRFVGLCIRESERPEAILAWTVGVCVGLCNMDSKLEEGQRCRCCSWFGTETRP